MTQSLRKGAPALFFIGAAALLAAPVPALAADPAEHGYFGGTYRYIGPGASSLPPEAYVEVVPGYPATVYAAPAYPAPIYAPPVYDEPEIVLGPPVVEYDYGYAGPDAGMTFVEPDGSLAVGLD